MKTDGFLFKIGPPSEAPMVPPVCHPNALNDTYVLDSDLFNDGNDDITELDPETSSAPEQSSFPPTVQMAPSNQTSSLPVTTGIEDQARTDDLPPSTEPAPPQTLNQPEFPQMEIAKQVEIDNQTGYINKDGIRVPHNPYDIIHTRLSKRKRPAPAGVSVDVSNEDNIQAKEISVSATTVTLFEVCSRLFLSCYCG